MRGNSKLVLGVIFLIVLLLSSYFYLSNSQDTQDTGVNITSFEECAEAGYPILDSFPEQCETPDGRRFTRETDSTEISRDEMDHIESKSDLIVIEQPQPFSVVSSPLTISGEARGYWFFEASFPIRLLDSDGEEIPLEPDYIMTANEWMTEDFVQFEQEVTFESPATQTGTLIFERANPSGLSENADELRIPIRFTTSNDTQEQTVELFYYNPDLDEDESGNILCSEEGLVAVNRDIPVTQTPIQDTIRLLLRGEITPAEEAQGITTEFPLEGFELQGATLEDGILTLSFDDPNNSTSGGSCRAGILWLQIRETAEQFEAVDEVRFQPETLFQP